MKKGLLLVFLVLAVSFTLANENIKKAIELIEKRDYPKAKEILEKMLENNKNDHQAYYHLAQVYFREGNLDDATDNAEKAVELADENADYHFLLGEIYGRDARDASVFRQPFLAKNCKNEFMRTIELDSTHVRGHMGLAEYMFYAPGIVGGDSEEAVRIAKDIIKLDETSGIRLLTKYLIAGEKYQEAKPHIDRLVELDEIIGRIRLINYYGGLKDSTNAEQQFVILENVIGENPDYFWFYNSYGYALLKDNRPEEALEKFKIQAKIAPERANSYDSLGEVYFALKQYDLALSNYKKALEIDPDLESAEEKMEQLKEIMENKK